MKSSDVNSLYTNMSNDSAMQVELLTEHHANMNMYGSSKTHVIALSECFSCIFSETNGNWKVSRFHLTPLLASYLLAFFVSEFEYDESYTKRGVRFRVWSTPEAKKKRGYGLKGAINYMEFFEEYFGVQDIVTKQGRLHLAFCRFLMT
ncbi:hypothetical protein Y032_0009g768 [Ancylostoma ceylanicum]|uniref:Uncharacterized protein n=3 Tax=Ancylostoma ceylanicum TaxID=53326 RepID=A0A016VL77_9BILA|nr:hypothetical protein Y032_0009g768 [Ancylostoma ceylanicum]